MDEIIKWVGKVALQCIAWVFILSITIGETTLFEKFNNVLVQNALVQSLDEEMANIWYKISETAKVTFNEVGRNTEIDKM
jgi:hypothetical protein